MWTAKYTNVDKSGLKPELVVTVEFSNGDQTLTRDYTVMPADFPDGLADPIQFQVDILNAKDTVTDQAISVAVGKVLKP